MLADWQGLAMMKRYLQMAVAEVMMLRAVSDGENDQTIKEGPKYTYAEYLEVVKTAATIYDKHSSGHCFVNIVQTTEDPA